MSWIKSSLVSLVVAFLALGAIELFLAKIFGFEQVATGDTSCKRYVAEHDFSQYQVNCRLVVKHWEQSYSVAYEFNSYGRREVESSKNASLIAFVGDSFTLGAMVPIESNYNFYAINHHMGGLYGLHNYGVSAEEFHNIINKLTVLDFGNYENVIYGLTPNDLFDIVDGSDPVLSSSAEGKQLETKSLNLFRSVKSFLLSSATSRALLHMIMKNDEIYYSTYLARVPYSGYLKSPLSEEFVFAFKVFKERIEGLPTTVRMKLKIFLLPQRAEVVAHRLGRSNAVFRNEFLRTCEDLEIECGSASIEPLAALDESHFPVDGHLTIEGNQIVAKELSNWLKKILIKN